MNRYCTECGNELKVNANYCEKCGAKITSEPVETSQMQLNKKKRKFGCLKYFLIGIVSFIVIVIALLFWPIDTNDQMTLVPVSNEFQQIELSDGVSVKISPYILTEDTELTVETVQESNLQSDALKTVRVELEDYHELDDFLEIQIPFDPMIVQSGAPGDVLEVYSINPTTGQEEVELIDVKDDMVVVYTDHLSDFTLKEVPLGKKIRRSDIGEISQEECIELIKKVNATYGDDSTMIEIGFDSLSKGTSMAGQFETFASALYETPMLKKKVYGKLGTVGNTFLYISLAKNLYEGMETGNYSGLVKTIKDNSLSMLMGFANPAAQVAYTAGQIGLAQMEELKKEVDAIADEKYVVAYNIVYNEITSNYKESHGDNWKGYWYKEWYDKIKGIASSTSDAESFSKAIDAEIAKEVKQPLTGDNRVNFLSEVGKYLDKKQGEDQGILGNIIKKMESSFSDYDENVLVEQKKKEMYQKLRPVIQRVSKNLMTKAEQGYYKTLTKIQKDIHTPYSVTIDLQGQQPEGSTSILELVSEGETVYEVDVSNQSSHTLSMSFVQYVNLKKPSNLRLVTFGVGESIIKDQVDFQFKVNDQQYSLSLPEALNVSEDNEEEEVETVDKVTDTEEDTSDNENDQKSNSSPSNADDNDIEDANVSNDAILEYQQKIDLKIKDMEERIKVIETEEIPYWQNQLDSHKKGMQEGIDMFKDLIANTKDDDYHQKELAGYNREIEKYETLLSWVDSYYESGLSSHDPEGEELLIWMKETYTPTWGGGADAIMALHGVYYRVYEKNKLEELIGLCQSNYSTGINQSRYDELISDFELRRNSPATQDIGDGFYGGKVLSGEESKVYKLLYQFGKTTENVSADE